jgi:peptide/nickel transport system ATP-binding protein
VVEQKKKIQPAYAMAIPELLREVNLPETILHRTPGTLSGGECLRVSIARALLTEPEVLICDESTSSLDSQTRDSIIELLRHLVQKRGLALVLISHDEHIIKGLASEVLVMAGGKVVEQGPAEQVIRYPTHHMTRKIFSSHATLASKRPSLDS